MPTSNAFVYRVTDDLEVKSLIVARLLDLGYSHNRFHVHEVVVDLLASLEQSSDAAVAEEAIEENREAAAWYAEEALKTTLAKPVAAALRAPVSGANRLESPLPHGKSLGGGTMGKGRGPELGGMNVSH